MRGNIFHFKLSSGILFANRAHELHLEFFFLTLDQPVGQVCVGAGQVAQSALQVAHFVEKTLIFVTQLQLG